MHSPCTASLRADDRARLLGEDPATGRPVWLRNGRYGWYIELLVPAPAVEGEGSPGAAASAPAAEEEPTAGTKRRPGRRKKQGGAAAAAKPKRAALGRSEGMPEVSMEQALQLLAWPKVLGRPASKKSCTCTILSVPAWSLSSKAGAVDMSGSMKRMPVQELGMHPESGQPVMAAVGQFGPYASHAGTNAALPKVGGTP